MCNHAISYLVTGYGNVGLNDEARPDYHVEAHTMCNNLEEAIETMRKWRDEEGMKAFSMVAELETQLDDSLWDICRSTT